MNSNYAAQRFGVGAFGARAAARAEFPAPAPQPAALLEETASVSAAPSSPRPEAVVSTPAAPPTRSRSNGSGAAPASPPAPPLDPPEPPASPVEPPNGEPEARPPLIAPGAPRFDHVPEAARHPLGPYRQAPEEFGGQWWLVTPFTGEEPWTNLTFPPAEEPEGVTAEFLSVFGPRPERQEGRTYWENKAAEIQWEQDLEHFRGVGVPDGFTAEQIEAAADVLENWGLGRPVFYEGRYGWKARFPASSIPDFEANPFTAVEAPHLVVARFQVKLARNGEEPLTRHPFVPPQVFGDAPLETPVRAETGA